MNWTSLDTWIVLTGALVAVACAIPGTWLVLMRNSLFGDAISHAVLPGLAIAFIATGSREPWAMLAGAIAAGAVTSVLSHWTERHGRLETGAALGVVFCSLFALGLILIRVAADRVDLDPDCVLYGTLETAVLQSGGEIPRVTWQAGLMLLVNGVLTLVFWKELRLAAFDPAHAAALGLRPQWFRQGVGIATAVTAVAAFEAVGSILVIAMMVVPAVAAGLWFRNLGGVMLGAILLALLSAPLGHLAAVWLVPPAAGLVFQQPFGAVNTAAMMTVAAGLLFLLCHLAARLRHRPPPHQPDPATPPQPPIPPSPNQQPTTNNQQPITNNQSPPPH